MPFPRSRRTAFTLVSLLALAAVAWLTASAALADGPRANAPWPQFKRDGARTGLGTVNGPATLAQKWITGAGDAIVGGPVISDDGTVYVTMFPSSGPPRVAAFRSDGTRKWVFSPERVNETTTVNGKPTYPLLNSRGQVVFGTEDGYVIGVNPDGSQAWRFDTRNAPYGNEEPQTITAPPGAAANYGRVLVATQGGNVYELEDGAYAGVRRADGSIRAGAAVAPDGTLVWATTNKTVYGGISIGGDKWKVTVDGAVIGTPAVSKDNIIYVPTEAGTLYALRTTDGGARWSVKVGGGAALRASPAIGPDGTVYVPSSDGSLYALDPSNGAQKWSFAAGGVTGAPTVGADGTIYIGSNDSNVYVLNTSGVKQSSWKTDGSIDVASPAIGADGTLYAGSRDTKLYAFKDGGPPAGVATAAPTSTTAPAAPPAPTATPVPAIPTGRVDPAPDGVYFFETGHNLRGVFLEYFNANGGLAQYGYPRTEQITLADGKIVQWFQRARLEFTTANGIQLGLLGDELLTGMGALR